MTSRAVADFKDLNAAEQRLVAACRNGGACFLGDERPTESTPDNTIRADLLRVLITGGTPDCGLHETGVWLEGGWIAGQLDLSYTRARGRTILGNCHFAEEPRMEHAALHALSLDGSHLPGLWAQRLVVKGSLLLRSVAASGTVDVGGADIGGQLACSGATFDGKAGMALNAERLKVAHGFFWRQVKGITGLVILNGAQVSDLADDVASWPNGADQFHLDGFAYDRIASGPTDPAARLPWLRAGSNFGGTFYPQPYTQLAKVLAGMGHASAARRILLARETRLAGEQWTSDRAAYQAARDGGVTTHGDMGGIWLRMWLSRLWSGMIRGVAGYGYAPQRALYWTAGFIALASVLYFLGWQFGVMVPNSAVILTSADWAAAMGAPPSAPAHGWGATGSARHYETFYSLAYATDVFVPLVDLGQESAWAATTVTWFGFGLRWFTFALEIIGWIVTALGAAAITGIIQRGRE